MDARSRNRALLARQHLLERASLTPLQLTEHLVGLQSQAPLAAYLGYWSRLLEFDPEQVSALLADRALVRIALQRGTVHLVSAADAAALRPLLQPVLDSFVTGAQSLGPGVDRAELTRTAAEFLEKSPCTLAELAVHLSGSWPEVAKDRLSRAARCWLPLVQVPPRGLWGRSGAARHTTLQKWLSPRQFTESSVDDLVVRYLAAFGPARVRDAQAWSGLTRLGEVFERLGERLVRFASADGPAFYDLPEAPRPGADTPAPVRLVADFDNLILSHADRSHILADDHRRAIFPKNGLIPGTILVDGFVAGTWRTTAGVLEVRTFARLARGVRDEAEQEGLRLLDFLRPGSTGEVRLGLLDA